MQPDAQKLVHLCGADEWAAASIAGEHRPPSLSAVGFVHLSTRQQVHLPANRLYRGRSDLVLLYLNRALLDSEVRWEPGVPSDPESMLFPHLYGPLPVGAVTGITFYPPDPGGGFPSLDSSPDSPM